MPPVATSIPDFYVLPPTNALAGAEPLKDNSGRTIAPVWHNPQSILALEFSMAPVQPKL